MKFIIKRKVLLGAIERASIVISRKVQTPIQGFIALKLVDNWLHLAAKNSESWIKIPVFLEEVQDRDNPETTIPALKFLKLLKQLEDEYISFSSAGINSFLVSGSGRFKFQSLPFENFRGEALITDEKKINVSQSNFKLMLQRALVVAGKRESIEGMNGVSLELSGNDGFYLVGTNGRQLGIMIGETPSNDEGKFLIPRKSAACLLSLLQANESSMSVSFNTKIMRVELEQPNYLAYPKIIFCFTILNEQFPDWFAAIPVLDETLTFSVEKEVMKAALRRGMIVAKDDYDRIFLEISKNNLKLIVLPDTPDAMSDEVRINYPGSGFKAAFNGQYLLDCLNCLMSNEVYLRFTENKDCCEITASNEPYRFFVMGMNPNG